MAVWPFLIGMAGLVAVLARDRAIGLPAGVMLGAYAAGRVARSAPLGEPAQMLAFAAIWLLAAFLILRVGTTRAAVVSAVLTGASLCYLWARLTAAPWVFGSLPFVLSDILAAIALLILGAGAMNEFVGRISVLGRNRGGRGMDSGRGARRDTQAQE